MGSWFAASMTWEELPLRRAVRALVIDPADRVLAVKLHLQRNGWTGWVLPGGGIQAGEDDHAALRRELVEETGLTDPFIGPVVCRRTQRGPDIAPGYGGQQENIYLVPCREFDPEPAFSVDELQAEGIVDMGWFTPEELRTSTERFVPRDLRGLLDRVLEFGGSVDPLVIDL